jgi:hypothetical protein
VRTRDRLLADAAYLAGAALGKTLRFTEEGRGHVAAARAAGRPPLFALWHNRLLYLGYRLARERLVIMVSRSRDGDLIARAAHDYGIAAVRGSSTRGGAAAVRALARAMREHGFAGFVTPDGPRGPRYRLQPGVLLVARLAGVSIAPAAIGFSRQWVFRSWDGFLLPKPFAAARIVYGEPFAPPAEADAAGVEAARVALEERLNEVTARADRPFSRDAGSRGAEPLVDAGAE